MPGIQNVVTNTSAFTRTYFCNINIVRFTSSGTYTPSSTLQFAIVECWGPGGGAAWGYPGAGAGGSGGYACSVFTPAQIGSSRAITIGTGGTGATATTLAGSNGGTTTFSTLITCNGGVGALRAYQTPNTGYIYANLQGSGAAVSTGGNWFNLPGAAALYGINAASINAGGIGGAATYGIGAGGISRSGVSVSVPSNVGAGAGGTGVATNAAGANGSNGLVIITEFTLS